MEQARLKPRDIHLSIENTVRRLTGRNDFTIGASTVRRYRPQAFIPRKKRYSEYDLEKWSYFALQMFVHEDVEIAQEELLKWLERRREMSNQETQNGESEGKGVFRTVDVDVASTEFAA